MGKSERSSVQPSQLFELFLVPDIPFHKTQFYRGSANATQLATSQEERINDFGDYGDDDYGNGGSDGEDGLDGWGDVNFDATDDLISAPRKVAQIGINYARASKQVGSQCKITLFDQTTVRLAAMHETDALLSA